MTLHAPYDRNNVFAKILRGELPSVRVFEDDVALAFMDVFPMGEGHTLVIPKHTEARHFIDLPERETGEYMVRVQRVARAVEKGLKPDGIRIFQFNGAPAGQSVFHLHFHVLPVWEGRAVGPHASGTMKSAAELEPVAAKIRAGF